MWSKAKLTIYAITSVAGLVWPFYFIVKFANQVKNNEIPGSIVEIGNTFLNGAWATPTSGFVSADTAVLLVGIFVFYAAEGKRLKMKLWGLYYPLTFIISLAFSFGAFMFFRERALQSKEQ